jgi:hypothetical protein
LPFGSRYHSGDAAGSWREKNYDHGVLHRKETDHVRCSSKRWHIRSAVFDQQHIPWFENNEPEFS